MNNFHFFASQILFCFAISVSLAQMALAADSATSKAQILDVYGLNNLVDGLSGEVRSAVAGPSYSDVESKLRWLATSFSDVAALVQYGQSVHGQNLNMLRIAISNLNVANRSAVEISGVIHGNEYLGIEDKLAQHFVENYKSMPGLKSYLESGGIIYFIPIVNPDGYEKRHRLNSNGADLNRDFDLIPTDDKRFSQPETTSLVRYIENDLIVSSARLKLSMDYHCCVPAMITPWAYVDQLPDAKDQNSFDSFSSIAMNVLGFESGNAMQTVNYLAEGSSIDYFYAKYKTVALAIEGNWMGETQALAKHIEFWDQVFLSLANPVPEFLRPAR